MKGDSEPTKILGIPGERLPAYLWVLLISLAKAEERLSQNMAIAVVPSENCHDGETQETLDPVPSQHN